MLGEERKSAYTPLYVECNPPKNDLVSKLNGPPTNKNTNPYESRTKQGGSVGLENMSPTTEEDAGGIVHQISNVSRGINGKGVEQS